MVKMVLCCRRFLSSQTTPACLHSCHKFSCPLGFLTFEPIVIRVSDL